jgi:hypothetical protein
MWQMWSIPFYSFAYLHLPANLHSTRSSQRISTGYKVKHTLGIV